MPQSAQVIPCSFIAESGGTSIPFQGDVPVAGARRRRAAVARSASVDHDCRACFQLSTFWPDARRPVTGAAHVQRALENRVLRAALGHGDRAARVEATPARDSRGVGRLAAQDLGRRRSRGSRFGTTDSSARV
jgi:hypothetical protein